MAGRLPKVKTLETKLEENKRNLNWIFVVVLNKEKRFCQMKCSAGATNQKGWKGKRETKSALRKNGADFRSVAVETSAGVLKRFVLT